jgi:hypothetical protein
MKHLAFAIFAFVNSVNACELTDEYTKARNEVTKWARYEYQECNSSVSEFYYWQAVAKCKEEGRGENIGGGCQHVAAHTPLNAPPSAYTHCEALKVSIEEAKAKLSEYVVREKIKKCK